MKTIDRLQVTAFQSLFKIRRASGMSVEVAFASAIVDTSNNTMGEAISRRPDLIKEWIKKYSKHRPFNNQKAK